MYKFIFFFEIHLINIGSIKRRDKKKIKKKKSIDSVCESSPMTSLNVSASAYPTVMAASSANALRSLSACVARSSE